MKYHGMPVSFRGGVGICDSSHSQLGPPMQHTTINENLKPLLFLLHFQALAGPLESFSGCLKAGKHCMPCHTQETPVALVTAYMYYFKRRRVVASVPG